MEQNPTPQSPEAYLTAKIQAVCEQLTGEWLVENDYLPPDRLQCVSEITIMSSGEDEGVDLRLDIEKTESVDFLGVESFILQRRVGTSDKTIKKERYTVTPQKVVEVYPVYRAKETLTLSTLRKLDEHIQEIMKKPLTVFVRLKYDNEIAELPEPA